MWTFDGERWHQDGESTPERGTRQDDEWRPEEAWPDLQVIEIRRDELEQRFRDVIPWLNR